MLVFFNGCSHTEGSTINTERTWSNIVLKSIEPNSKFFHIHGKGGFDDEFLFRHINGIEKYLKGNCGISVAKSGKGNDAICFETINYIEYLKKIDKKPDYVCIQWSGTSRKIIQTIDNKINFINPHSDKNLLDRLNFEPLGSSLTKTYYIILQNYLQNNNINYVFMDYMGIDEKTYNDYIDDSIDYTKVVTNKKTTLIDELKKKNWVVDRFGHPNEIGYHYLASKVCDILNINVISKEDFDYIERGSNKKYETKFEYSLLD